MTIRGQPVDQSQELCTASSRGGHLGFVWHCDLVVCCCRLPGSSDCVLRGLLGSHGRIASGAVLPQVRLTAIIQLYFCIADAVGSRNLSIW